MRFVLLLALLFCAQVVASPLDELSLPEQKAFLEKGLTDTGYFKYKKIQQSYLELSKKVISVKLEVEEAREKLNSARILHSQNKEFHAEKMQQLALTDPKKALAWEKEALRNVAKSEKLMAAWTMKEAERKVLLKKYKSLLLKVSLAESSEREKLLKHRTRIDRLLKKWTEVKLQLAKKSEKVN